MEENNEMSVGKETQVSDHTFREELEVLVGDKDEAYDEMTQVEDNSKEELQEKISEDAEQKPEIIEKLNQLEEKMDMLNTLFIKKIQHTTHEEKIVDQMHGELQKYKDDMYSQLVRPILLEIIAVRDSIHRMSKNFELKPVEEQNVPLKTFSDYGLDIQDILEMNNIMIYQGQEGEPFNPIKQRAIKKIKTPVEELHGKIAESLSSGYEYMGKTISPEKVVVYFFEQSESAEGDKQ